jgi:fermentation-respiration switch protein FrsA (DUF1100 family)
MRMLIVAIVVAVALLFALVWAQQRRLIYFPFADVPAPSRVGLSEVEEVTFGTSDGITLRGWFVSGLGRGDSRTPPVTMIVFNGNAGNRAYRAPLASALRRHGVSVLLFDYRGYGDNPGIPTQRGLGVDGRAARAYLLTRPDVDPTRLVYFGESLGTAVAVDLASEHPPAALILRSPFTSLSDIGQHHYPFLPVRLLLRDRFDSLARIRQVGAPLFVIAGDRDDIIPAAHSRRLFDAASEPKTLLIIEGADHNDEALLTGGDMIAAIVRFVRRVETS